MSSPISVVWRLARRSGHRPVAAVASMLASLLVSVAGGAGWHFSGVLLRPNRRVEYLDHVTAVRNGEVWLRRTRWAELPGEWALRWPEGLAVVGSVSGVVDGQVRRPLRPGGPRPPVGPVAIDAGPYDPDPSALDLAFQTVSVRTPVGGCPAWLVPASGSTWVVAVHGRGADRRECLRVLPVLHELGHPVLAISYRNDVAAPPSPDGYYHLGDTEWEDVAAAVEYAVAAGAGGVVLYGWSMGAAIVGAYLDRASGVGADAVRAVVWDSPLVDWSATLRQQAALRRLPPGLTALAVGVTRLRIGIDFRRFDLRRHPPARRPPTLLFHGDADTAVPVGPSRALAAEAARLGWPLRYLEVAGAEHTASWNVDRRRYESAVAQFLTEYAPADGSAARDVAPADGSAPTDPFPGRSRCGQPRQLGRATTGGGTMSGVTQPESATEKTATLHTSEGDIRLVLFPDQAPKTVANFVGLATGTQQYSPPNASGGSSGPFYDGSIFHRVIAGFMVQGGDPTGTGRGGPGYKFADEFHPELRFDRPYLLAMANAGPGTNGSQFFITVGPTPHLNRRHTIFGEVADAESRAVVDAIANTQTGPQDRPLRDIVIERIEVP